MASDSFSDGFNLNRVQLKDLLRNGLLILMPREMSSLS